MKFFRFSFLCSIIFFKPCEAQTHVNGYAHVISIAGSTINVSNVNETYDTFEDGEKIIIMQMQDDVIGDTSNTATFGDIGSVKSAGLYEYATILSHTELAGVVTSITIAGSFTNTYNVGTNNSVQVISYPVLGSPNYTTTSDITGLAWDGSIGGVIAFEVNGILNLNNNINADGIGFRGGQRSDEYGTYLDGCDELIFKEIPGHHGSKGEGIYKNTSQQWNNARGKIINGGGGGNEYNAGGGGGGGYTRGGEGGPGYGCFNAPNGVGGKGGIALSPNVNISAARLFMGGGGGGGQQDTYTATDGENGGGIIIIKASKIKTPQVCASILITANGISNNIPSAGDGAGGAGAGGTITINCPDFDVINPVCLLISANGGNGGDCTYSSTVGAGGGGGQGAVIYTNCTPAIVINSSFTKSGKGGKNDSGGASFAENGNGIDNLGVFYLPQPIALFGSTINCKGTATVFNDSSTSFFGTINSWSWNFGDTILLNTSQNPSHLYSNAGSHSATLIIKNNFGCVDTITKLVHIYYDPITSFTHTDVCFGDTMHFINTSSVDTSASITSYLWVFGDGSANSSLKNENHYFSLPGTYPVKLVTTTANGCSDTAVVPVKVYDAPTAAFNLNNTCLFDSALFTDTSVNPTMGTIANWSWDFGDASPIDTAVSNPHHLYPSSGNYQVTLITYSSNLNCSDTVKHTITIFPMPLANYGFENVCLNQQVHFTDSSTVSAGTITSWFWGFADGSTASTVQNPANLYANAGTYVVSLIITTSNSCKDTVTKSVIVHPLPNVGFSAANVCLGSNTLFADVTTIATTDALQSWTWNFGDNSSLVLNQNPSHLYAAAGAYPVQLLVVSNFGCSDSLTKTAIVNPNPIVNFTANDTAGCEPLCVSFQNVSSNNASSLWDLGDGSPASNSQDQFHCFANDSVFSSQFFTVTLTVTSDSGCITTKTKNNYIAVYPSPNASFTVQPETAIITNPVISITDLSTGTNFWKWNFGDTTTSMVANPAHHSYADTGTYQIILIASTQYNCKDTAYQTITIEPDFMFFIPNAFTPDGDGVNDTFTGKGVFINTFEMTIFDRWGNLIFISDDINKGWDGKVNHGNEMAKQDVYVYLFKVIDFKLKPHSYKGIVSLIR
jgi:gliding motility-associated-like protein